jgi:RNA polymerase sigma factor (sigma-70 family)
MLDRMNPEGLFLDSIPRIESIAASVCRMYSVRGDDADEFASWVKERLIDNDYAVLRKYRGESELNTFLTVVVTRLFHAHAREQLGRWRNSATAERLGQVAKDLEVLVHRDGCSLREAGERLRSAGRTEMSDAELARLLAQLPIRSPLRPVDAGEDPLERLSHADRADDRVAAAEAERHRLTVLAALFRAMGGLTAEERIIVRMNLADGRTVAEISRALNLDQQGLYRRLKQLRERLQRTIESHGVSRSDVRKVLEDYEA